MRNHFTPHPRKLAPNIANAPNESRTNDPGSGTEAVVFATANCQLAANIVASRSFTNPSRLKSPIDQCASAACQLLANIAASSPSTTPFWLASPGHRAIVRRTERSAQRRAVGDVVARFQVEFRIEYAADRVRIARLAEVASARIPGSRVVRQIRDVPIRRGLAGRITPTADVLDLETDAYVSGAGLNVGRCLRTEVDIAVKPAVLGFAEFGMDADRVKNGPISISTG